MLLAWQLWELTPRGGVATLELAHEALAQVIADRRPELDATWRSLSTVEQRVAVAVAHGLAPSGSRAQRATGIRNRSAAGQAANSLVAAGQLRRNSDGHVALVDPLLASYLRNRHPLPCGIAGRRRRRIRAAAGGHNKSDRVRIGFPTRERPKLRHL